MFYYVFNNCIFLHIHVLKWIYNTYSVREICTSKTILITTKHAEICFEELHQALRLKWCLSGNPDTLKVTDPQGATGTLQVIVVKQKESFFLYLRLWLVLRQKQPAIYGEHDRVYKYLEFFHSKTLLQALPRWWPSQLTWFLVLVHVKKTLLLSLWLAVFDSFLLKDSFNCHKT